MISKDLYQKIIDFEDPKSESLNEEKLRLISFQIYFTVFLNNEELYDFLLKKFEKDIVKTNKPLLDLKEKEILVVSNKKSTKHYCVTKKEDNKNIEFAVLQESLLYKINLSIKKKRGNECNFFYTESYRFLKPLGKKDYKNKKKVYKNEIVKKVIELKEEIIKHTKTQRRN